jgi:hypothetical protein
VNTGHWDTGRRDDIEEKFDQAKFIDEKPERNSFKVAVENRVDEEFYQARLIDKKPKGNSF